MFSRSLLLALLPFVSIALIGCGGGGDQKTTAKVSGKLVFDGSPVTGGSITLAPKGEGKPASGVVNSDGTFVVGTYDKDDGAVVGTHTVRYSAPTAETPAGDAHAASKPSPFAGLVPKEKEVTVESGGSELTIELVKP